LNVLQFAELHFFKFFYNNSPFQVSIMGKGARIARFKLYMKTKIWVSIVLVILLANLGILLTYVVVHKQKITPRKPQTRQSANQTVQWTPRQRTLHEQFENRTTQDEKIYTKKKAQEVEQLFEDANKQKFGSPEQKKNLQDMVRKFPGLNRTGCAVLYLGMMSKDNERTRYFQDCVDKYNDCFFSDGAQVGPYARLLMAQDYLSQDEAEKAKALFDELKTNYPDAIDFKGFVLAHQEKFSQRMAQDEKNYTKKQVDEAEQLFENAQKRSPEQKAKFESLVQKYPGLNRAGCAALDLAYMFQGDERARCLESLSSLCRWFLSARQIRQT